MRFPTRLNVRRVVTFSACVVVIAIAFALGGVLEGSRIDTNTARVRENTALIERLRQDNAARDKQAKANAGVFALVLYAQAANFATPPYPDPARVIAVGKTCSTADYFFKVANGQDVAPPACP